MGRRETDPGSLGLCIATGPRTAFPAIASPRAALQDVAFRLLPGDSWKRAARGNYLTSVWIKAENVPSLPRGLVELHSSNNGDGILSS